MGRAPCCDKANVKKGPWSPEEDAKLKSYIDQHGTGDNWIALPQKIGLKRCGKSCRLRWLNYLRPDIKHGGFSEEEDNIICSLYISIGSRWSIIAAQLPGRTDNDIKNYWNTRLKKKLLGKHRKEKINGRGKEAPKGKQHSGLNYQHTVRPVSLAPPPPSYPVFQPIPYSDEEPRFNNHASIRRLLMKLGGRFSGEVAVEGENLESDVHQLGADDQTIVQSVYNNPIRDLVSSSDHQIPLLNAVPPLPICAPHFDDVGTDLSDVMNPQRLFYDDMMKRATCGESMDWGDMNPSWVFASNTNQGLVQEALMEELICCDKLRYSNPSLL